MSGTFEKALVVQQFQPNKHPKVDDSITEHCCDDGKMQYCSTVDEIVQELGYTIDKELVRNSKWLSLHTRQHMLALEIPYSSKWPLEW